MKPQYRISDPLMQAYLSQDFQGYVKKSQPKLVKEGSLQSSVIVLASVLGIIGLVLFSSCNVQPARAEEIDVEKLATAIYYAENSVKYPYGIKSINTHGDKAYARKKI